MKVTLAQAAARAAAGKKQLEQAFNELSAFADDIVDPLQIGQLNALLWDCAAGQYSRDRYFSQYGQDAYLDTHVFGGQRDGVFIEVGGYDGVTGSNCLYFELFRGWSGILIEGIDEYFEQASEFRRCACINCLVGDGSPAEVMIVDAGPTQMSGLTKTYEPEKLSWVENQLAVARRTETLPTRKLADVLDEQGVTYADLISLDIEGGEETVLRDFPFDRIDITCWLIETGENRDRIVALMYDRGFDWIDRIGHDDVFLKAS